MSEYSHFVYSMSIILLAIAVLIIGYAVHESYLNGLTRDINIQTISEDLIFIHDEIQAYNSKAFEMIDLLQETIAETKRLQILNQ